jgi:hypothetical protein
MPVAYASRKFLLSESNFLVIEKIGSMEAVCFANILLAFVRVNKANLNNSRLISWTLVLQSRENVAADY